MFKNYAIIIILLLAVIVSFSGCTNKQAPNGTFGEKTVSIKNITILNSSTEDYEYQNTQYYIIRGSVKNNNQYDAFNLKIKATVFDANGTIVAVNNTVYLDPKVISAGGEAFYAFQFNNTNNRIVRYELQLISVDAKA